MYIGKNRALGLLMVCLLVVSSSCGFRPRGSTSKLTDPGTVFVDASREISLAADLRNALREQAIPVALLRANADTILQLTGERESQRIISVQSTGRVSEFELSHSVFMLIAEPNDKNPSDKKNSNEEKKQAANQVEVIREYTYNERGVLGKEDEARILRGEMRAELIRQIVLRTIASLASAVASNPSMSMNVGD